MMYLDVAGDSREGSAEVTARHLLLLHVLVTARQPLTKYLREKKVNGDFEYRIEWSKTRTYTRLLKNLNTNNPQTNMLKVVYKFRRVGAQNIHINIVYSYTNPVKDLKEISERKQIQICEIIGLSLL